MRTLLRYPGGKSRAITILLRYLPKDITEMATPFFGGGAFEFACASKGIRVFGSDNFEPLVTFWQQVFKNPAAVAARVKVHHPLSRTTFYSLKKRFNDIKDDVERAAVFFVLNRCSYSGVTLSGGMSPNHLRFNEAAINRLENFKVDKVKVHCLDFEKAIKKHQKRFLYLDPPYMNGQALYGINGDMHKDFQHERLAKILQKRDHWIMSYNDHSTVCEMYEGYKIVRPEWPYGMANVKRSTIKKSTEILILSKDFAA